MRDACDVCLAETSAERRKRKENERLREYEKKRVRSRAKVPGRGRGRPPKAAVPMPPPAPPPTPTPVPPPRPQPYNPRPWRRCQGTTRHNDACEVDAGHGFRDAAPLRAGSAFCAHHQPDKFTGTQCAGVTKAGTRCRVFSASCYAAARQLKDGAAYMYCRLHAPQAFELVRCAGVTRGGRLCRITS